MAIPEIARVGIQEGVFLIGGVGHVIELLDAALDQHLRFPPDRNSHSSDGSPSTAAAFE
jgi:hypothetical protein